MWKYIVLFIIVILSLTIPRHSYAQTSFVPNTSDWQTQGVAIREGEEGEWDRYLWGAFANSVIKKDGVYYLYYQGSRYYDDACDSVAERAIGVATSIDGINWTKHPDNPIITWSQAGSIEEGAVSSGVLIDNNTVYLYYGANTGTGCNVSGNGRLAISSDGVNFTDQGQVINALSSTLWGRGDEVFPIGAYKYNNNWNVFYTPNGVSQSRRLGVISGISPTSFSSSSPVNSGSIPAWGTVSVVKNNQTGYAFVNDPGTNLPISVYSFSLNNPTSFILQNSYVFTDCSRGSVLYEPEINKWLMLCRSANASDSYIIKIVESMPATPSPGPTSSPIPTQTPTITPTPTAAPQPGDATGDGVVDGLDYIVWLNHYGESVSGYSNGDFDNSGIVDGIDYVVWLNNYNG